MCQTPWPKWRTGDVVAPAHAAFGEDDDAVTLVEAGYGLVQLRHLAADST